MEYHVEEKFAALARRSPGIAKTFIAESPEIFMLKLDCLSRQRLSGWTRALFLCVSQNYEVTHSQAAIVSLISADSVTDDVMTVYCRPIQDENRYYDDR